MAVFECTTKAKCKHCAYFETRGSGRSSICLRDYPDKIETTRNSQVCEHFALERNNYQKLAKI